MKIYLIIIIILIISHFSFSLIFSQDNIPDFAQAQIDEKIPDPEKESEDFLSEDDDDVFFDQDNLLKTEKKLPPLSNREKIVWAFRLSKAYPFL